MITAWVGLVVSSCALPPPEETQVSEAAASTDLAADPLSEPGNALPVDPPTPPPPVPAAVAAELDAASSPTSNRPSGDPALDSSGLVFSLLDPVFFPFDPLADLFSGSGANTDPLSLLLDAFLLDSLAPATTSGIADDFTYLERVCRDDTDLQDFLCRQRFRR